MQPLLLAVTDVPFVYAVLLKATLVLALGWAAHFLVRRGNPRWRVLAWRAAVLGVLLTPVLEWTELLRLSVKVALEPEAAAMAEPAPAMYSPMMAAVELPMAAAEEYSANLSPPENPTAKPLPPKAPLFSFGAFATAHPALLCAVFYALGVLALALRVALGVRTLRRALKSSTPAPPELQAVLNRVSKSLRIRRRAELRCVANLSSPLLVGLIRCRLLLPRRMLARDCRDRLPAILAHEAAHLRSNDLSWIFLMRLVSLVLWFHPLAWRMKSAHEAACEEVCDGTAAEFVGDATQYSRALAAVALEMAGVPSLACGVPMARSANVLVRLRALKRGITTAALRPRRLIMALVCAAAIIGAVGGVKLTAQAEEPDGLTALKARTDEAMAAEQKGNLEQAAVLYREVLNQAEEELSSDDQRVKALRQMLSNVDAKVQKSAQPTLSGPTRTLHFPSDHSLGTLSIVKNRRPGRWFFKNHASGMEYETEHLGQAQGDVIVPKEANVELFITGAPPYDLSALSRLNPDDLFMIGVSPGRGQSFNADTDLMPHIKGLTGLRYLFLLSVDMSDAGLQHLKNFTQLRHLFLGMGRYGDPSLRIMADLKSLETVWLGKGEFTDAGLAELARLPNLQEIFFPVTNVKGPGFEQLVKNPTLKYLSTDGESFGDATVAYLSHATSLVALKLNRTSITDSGLAHLRGLSGLEELYLPGNEKIRGPGLEHLQSMRSLKTLDLYDTKCSPDSLQHLKNLPTLEDLNILHCFEPHTDDTLQALSELHNLKKLDLGGNSGGPITDEGLKHLAKLTQLEKVSLMSGKGITDEGIAYLGALRNLKHLWLHAPSITDRSLSIFSGLQSLELLNISGTNHLTLSGVNQLNRLSQLQWLWVGPVLQDGAGLDLSNLTNLEDFCIQIASDTSTPRRAYQTDNAYRIEDVEGLINLKKLQRLQGVRGIDDKGLAKLAGLSQLSMLNVRGEGITDEGMRQLAGMKGLEHLILDAELTDEGLRRLEGLKALRMVTINSYSPISQAAVDRLRKALPNLWSMDVKKIERPNTSAPTKRPAPVKQAAADSTPHLPAPGEMAPPFSVQTLNGETFDLAKQRGNVVLLHFWATWCSPCVAGTPTLKKNADELLVNHPRVRFLDVCVEDSEARQREFIQKHELNWTHANVALKSAICQGYGVEGGVPQFFLIGPDGRILLNNERQFGNIDQVIEDALAEYDKAAAGVREE